MLLIVRTMRYREVKYSLEVPASKGRARMPALALKPTFPPPGFPRMAGVLQARPGNDSTQPIMLSFSIKEEGELMKD